MKCPICGGKGTQFVCDYDGMYDIVCDKCKGKGELDENGRPILTNEEYIRTCSTEELAKLIYKIAVTDVLMDRFFNAEIIDGDSGIKEAETWLKEKHHE